MNEQLQVELQSMQNENRTQQDRMKIEEAKKMNEAQEKMILETKEMQAKYS